MSADLNKQNRIPKYIEGKLAVCSFCGMRAPDFNYCLRCKRKLPENIRAVPVSSGTLSKKENAVPIRVPKYVEGKLAVCSFCGMRTPDFNYCLRCKRKLPKNVRAVPISSGTLPKKKNTEAVEVFSKRKKKEPDCLTTKSSNEEENSRKQELSNSRE